jgi:chorismate mutase
MQLLNDVLPVSDWPKFGSRPYLVAGPCGVESEEQMHAVASRLSACGVTVLRGGIWKPRTRPDSFQGTGIPGLEWLKSAAVSNGMLAATEVADPAHLDEALRAGIDIVWIGARTTVNPFLVQRIADALKGIDIPVMVKNPVTPDLELWIGAMERIRLAGINRIIAIHRGFTTFERTRYRNAAIWPIPIELKRRFPGLPVICDPSHIAGQRALVPGVAQTALDLHYDGLMVEVHADPDNAKSDRDQQLDPEGFSELLASLVVRSDSFSDVLASSKVAELRARIDEADRQLIGVLANRMDLSREIGGIKKEHDVTIYQLRRWNEILESRPELASVLGLNSDFIKKVFEVIHEESILQQTQVMNDRTASGEESCL